MLFSTQSTLANSSPSPSPSPVPSCTDVIKACDKVIAAQKKEIQLADLALIQQKDVIDGQARTIQSQEEKLNSVFRSPIVLIGLGVVAAILGGKLLK